MHTRRTPARRRLLLLLPLALAALAGCQDRELPTAARPEATPAGSTLGGEGPFAYVANFFSDNVSVINTSDNAVIATVAVGTGPRGVAITPDGAHAYVTNGNSNNVSVIRTSDNTVIATVAVGVSPIAVAITPDGAHAYVTNGNSNNVSVIRTSDTVVATVAVGSGPNGVAITPAPQGGPVFGSFQRPVRAEQLNVVTAGRTVPINFSLGGNFGMEIFAAGYPWVEAFACPGAGAARNTVSGTTTGVRQSRLDYDAATGQYTYLWVTEKGWAGSCRELRVKFAGIDDT